MLPWLDATLLLLAGIAGSIDAIGCLKPGQVLTANMTGNTILMGVSIGQGKLIHATRAFVALIGFITGVAIGAAIMNRREKGWQQTLSYSLTIEFFLVLSVVLLWLELMNSYHGFVVMASIIISAVSMGLQSATVRHLKIPGMVTTLYIRYHHRRYFGGGKKP